MPRKHKGPPQESVDSILLALCRRDILDEATFSHYLTRLDEEWTNGAREQVLRLLRTSDPSAHAAAVTVLTELATEFDLEELEDFVTDPTVSDIAKLTLSPLLKELGSELAEEGMMEYLNDPIAAMRQMQLRLFDSVEKSEMGVEAILLDVVAMPVEQRLGFISWLGTSNDPRAVKLLIPLLDNQPTKILTAVVDALEQIGPGVLRESVPALNRLIVTSSNNALKQHARRVVGNLTMHSSPAEAEEALHVPAEPQLPPYEALVTYMDGSGSQIILLAWRREDGTLKGVNVLHQDQTGIKDCYGVDEIDEKRWQELLHGLNERNIVCFPVPFEYARALVVEARNLSKRTRHKLPISYSIWRPLIEAGLSADSKYVVPLGGKTILEPLTLDEETLALAQQGARLYTYDAFASWLYEPLADIEPYINRYWATQNLLKLPDTHMPRRGRKVEKKSEEERKKELEKQNVQIMQEIIEKLIDERWRTLYETRLRRQAALLHLIDHEEEAHLARAVAAMLHPDSGIAATDQPFVQTFMHASIEQGPLRILAATLESKDIASFMERYPE